MSERNVYHVWGGLHSTNVVARKHEKSYRGREKRRESAGKSSKEGWGVELRSMGGVDLGRR